MILDFTVRITTNDGFDQVDEDMVALYKQFESAPDEDDRQNALELLLNVLEGIGPKTEYSVKTFATLTR